jgi:hypothetical protein
MFKAVKQKQIAAEMRRKYTYTFLGLSQIIGNMANNKKIQVFINRCLSTILNTDYQDSIWLHTGQTLLNS